MTDISHSHLRAGWLENQAWRILNALEPKPQRNLPAELRKLPDHLLRDIGVERRQLGPTLDDLTTRVDMLESRAALDAWLSSTVR
jgi:hypothetical protein